MWNIACYIRLSREDNDLSESDSITSQRKIIANYIKQNFEFDTYRFYVDENVTGTKFDREQFNILLNDINKGEINCIIVKDLSRFGRNYIDAGMFLEDFFPRHHIRFISILDGLDTNTNSNDPTSLIIRIKNLMHDNNSREISKKVRASQALMREQGKHISHATYGYLKDPCNKYKLIINKQVEHIVQWIFGWYINGMGVVRIAQKLNRMDLSCPSEYKSTGNLKSTDSSKAWRPNTIRKMLSNYTYIGCVHQGKKTTRNYKDHKLIYLNEDDHIIIENMHEPIIDQNTFDNVQRLIDSKIRARTAEHKERVYIFSGYLRCKDCGSSMLRCPTRKNGKEYVYYRCRRYKQKKKGCTNASPVKHDLVYKCILDSVMDHICFCCNLQLQLKEIHKAIRQSSSLTRLEKRITKAQAFIASQKKLKCSAYEDWKADNINKDDFFAVKSEIDRRIQSQVDVIERNKNEIDFYTSFDDGKIKWLENIVQYKDATELNRVIITALIQKIYVGQDQLITVVFNNCEKTERLKEYINEIKFK